MCKFNDRSIHIYNGIDIDGMRLYGCVTIYAYIPVVLLTCFLRIFYTRYFCLICIFLSYTYGDVLKKGYPHSWMVYFIENSSTNG